MISSAFFDAIPQLDIRLNCVVILPQKKRYFLSHIPSIAEEIVSIIKSTMGEGSMVDYKSKLLEVIEETKTTLVNQWESDGKVFLDNNYMNFAAPLSTCMGLTSLLLIFIAFKDEEIISDEDTTTITNIVNQGINDVDKSVKKDGYGAEPLLDSSASAKIFNQEYGNIDTVSWVLSTCILARYAQRKKKLQLSETTKENIYELIADTLKKIIDSQNDDGTWGFMTGRSSEKSLYFTYSAGSAIADFYDYVLGEIESVNSIGEDSNDADNKDKKLIKHLEDKSIIDDVKKELDQTREKLSKWLVWDCLPILPKIANCQNLNEDELNQAGIWKMDVSEDFKKRDLHYHNLYYAYYIIDLLISSTADKYFENLVKSKELDELKEHYKKQSSFSQEDYRYFFGDKLIDENSKKMFLIYMEQAIHSTRYHFLNSMRTGSNFWDTPDSELRVLWKLKEAEHNTGDGITITNEDIQRVLKNARVFITDPALVSMALRANTLYCYYISNQTDITLDKLFEITIENRSSSSEENCVKDLWDQISYNLPITERSVEALVDYYDYLRRYESVKPANVDEVKVEKITSKSEIDIAIESKIEKIIYGDSFMTEIKKILNKETKATKRSEPGLSFENSTVATDLLDQLDQLLQYLEAFAFNEKDSNQIGFFVQKLSKIHSELNNWHIKAKIAKHYKEQDESLTEIDLRDKAAKSFNVYKSRMDALFPLLIEDLNMEQYQYVDLYKKLKLK